MRGGTGRRIGDHGGVMIFALLALMLVGAITLGVMRLIAAQMGGGIRDLQSGQVFNIAQAGIHYAIGKLQLGEAASYAGETITITDGAATLGTATITVNCADTATPPPCTGPYAGYRRIISSGTLPVSGPTRTIAAVVQATTVPAGICAYAGGIAIGGGTIYSNVGSNASIVLAAGSPHAQISADQNVPQQFKGTAVAEGKITCGSSCAGQVQGGIFPSQPVTVCPAVGSPTYSPGGANLYVDSNGFTINDGTGYSWNDVRVAPGSCSGLTPYNDLKLQADPANPNVTTVVQINSLVVGNCSRVVILGVGKIELRIGVSGYTGLMVFANARFAVLPTDSPSNPAPVPASRFIVWVNTGGAAGATTAAQFVNAQLVAATILAPKARVYATGVQMMTGALWAYGVSFNSSGSFSSDISGLPPGATISYANYNKLRSWKNE